MSNFLCAAPWRGLHINPQGSIKTCCAGDPNMLGNLNSQTIEDVLHGPVLQEIRQTIRSGRLHEQYCYNCIQAERYGRSERDCHNQLNPGFDADQVSDTDYYPVLIDVRWNITCNLSCNYCGDKCSSKWADLKKIPVQTETRSYYEQVCDYLGQHQANIRQVALVGGEPLLLKENERLLDVIPESSAVNLITNLSVDLDTNRIFKKLATRQRVGWNVSFDNIGSRFEYVRYGGSWALIESNIDKIRACGHDVGIHAVYNLYNATRLTEFVAWAKARGIEIHWQSLFQPEYLDPLRLGDVVKQLAVAELEQVLARTDLTGSERGFFQQALANYAQPHDVLTGDLITHITEIESKYHTTAQGQFKQLWPELASIL